jgi:hypothetical protein
MSVRAFAAQVVHIPTASDDNFLRNAVETLERLGAQSEQRGYMLLGSLISIAKGEAEDGIRTRAQDISILERDHDDGVELMARKFAYRAAGQA